MDFETEAQEVCYKRVAAMMKDLFGEFAAARPDSPRFLLMIGSAIAEIAVLPWGDDDALINARAYVVSGAETTPDLMKYLLESNACMRFGAFGLDEDSDITFDYAIVGSGCDKVELRACVMAVVTTSDRFDDEIIARWGGERAVDKG